MSINSDDLKLQFSDSINIQGTQEANVDIILDKATTPLGSVTGIVMSNETPLKNATVKIFDQNNNPFLHTITDSNGAFIFNNLPKGSYNIIASLPGYLINSSINFSVLEGVILNVEIILETDPTYNLNAIAGIVLLEHSKPLGDAIVNLIDNSTNTAIAQTSSASDGEFLFAYVNDGEYTIECALTGYIMQKSLDFKVANGQILNLQINMIQNISTNFGTISGIIRDGQNNIVSNCIVGLYLVITNNDGSKTEQLIKLSKTNDSGKYLFGNIDSGNYIIKAKK